MNNVEETFTEYFYIKEVGVGVLRLMIYLKKLPQQLVDSNSTRGYYRNQIQFIATGPDELDNASAVIAITIHFDINPAYNDAVRSLLGDEAMAVFAEVYGDNMPLQIILRENYEFLNKDVQFLVNRLMLGSF